jgi:hypothetical protein
MARGSAVISVLGALERISVSASVSVLMAWFMGETVHSAPKSCSWNENKHCKTFVIAPSFAKFEFLRPTTTCYRRTNINDQQDEYTWFIRVQDIK